tara:strand:- start:3208 stop:7836 length:4629 start_codon:yes stop_codon:yes gene_type:complete
MEVMPEPDSPKKPIVLLIHGTFANLPDAAVADDHGEEAPSVWMRLKEAFGGSEKIVEVETSDEGEDWWQVGSPFWTQMKERLAKDGLTLAGDEEVWKQDPENLDENGNLKEHLRTFKWSSENTERARHKAGRRLFERILEYEREGREYHLIGHSHGGSTVWIALQQSILRRWKTAKNQEFTKLSRLKSWATVATPFLHYRGTKIGSWYGKVATVLMLVISLFMAGWIGVKKIESWSDTENPLGALLQKMEEARIARSQDARLSNAPKFPLRNKERPQPQIQNAAKQAPAMPQHQQRQDEAPVIPAALKESISKIGFKDVFAAVVEVVVALMLLVAPFLTVYLWARAARTESRNVYRETRAQNQAMLEFGNRWLGIFSTEDEAINGLRATTYLSGTSIVPKIEIPSETVFDSDRLIRFYRFFIRVFIAPFYNLIFGPAADNYLIAKVAKGAQGHNRMGCKLVDVTEGPILVEGYRYPPLPKEVNQEIIDQANNAIGKRSKEILVKTRTGISQFAWGGSDLTAVVHDVADELQGDELVHTSYFNHPFVGEALSLHARDSRVEVEPFAIEKVVEEKLTWKQRFGKVFKGIGWVSLGFGLATVCVIEAIVQNSNRPVYLLSALLSGIGIGVLVTSFRKRAIPPPRWSIIAGRAAGLFMIFIAVFYGVIRHLFPDVSLVAPVVDNFLDSESPMAHPGLLFSIFISLSATFFAVGLSYFRSNPQWSKSAGLIAFALVVASVWMADSATGTDWGPTVTSAAIVSILFGFYKAFSPLKHAEDVFCPFEVRKAASIDKELFLDVEPEPQTWLAALKNDIRSNLGKQEGVKSYALPLLDTENRMATVTAWLLIGGVLSMLLGIFTSGFFLMLAGIVAIPIAWLLSFRPALKATRGALKGGLALLNLNLMSFAFITGIVSLFTWFIYDEFIRILPAENYSNVVSYTSPNDGKPRLAVTEPGRILLWNPETRNQIGSVLEGSGRYFGEFIEISPDHKSLAWVDYSSIEIWDLETETVRAKLEVPTDGEVSCVAFRGDGGMLATGGMDGNLMLWNAETGKKIAGPFRLRKPIRSMDFHPTQHRLALGLDGGSIAIWDTESRVQIASGPIHSGDVTHLEYWNEKILSLGRKGSLKYSERLVDGSRTLVDRDLPPELKGKSEEFSATMLTAFPEARTLAVGFTDKEGHPFLQVLSSSTKGEWLKLALGHTLTSLGLFPGSDELFVRSYGSEVQLWNRSDGKMVGTLGMTFSAVDVVALSPDGATLVIGFGDGTVRFQSVETGEEQGRVQGIMSSTLNSGEGIIPIFQDGAIGMWSADTGNKLSISIPNEDGRRVFALTMVPPGGIFATSTGETSAVSLWSVRTGKELHKISGFEEWVMTGAFNPEGTILAIGLDGGTASLWDVATGEKLRDLDPDSSYSDKMVFSPDGAILAVTTQDNEVRLFNGATGESLARGRLSGHHESYVNALKFSPDSQTLATGSYDNTAKLWSVATGEELRTLSGHSDWVKDVAFGSDGKIVVTCADDGLVKLWDVESGNLIRTIHQFQFVPTPPEESTFQ